MFRWTKHWHITLKWRRLRLRLTFHVLLSCPGFSFTCVKGCVNFFLECLVLNYIHILFYLHVEVANMFGELQQPLYLFTLRSGVLDERFAIALLLCITTFCKILSNKSRTKLKDVSVLFLPDHFFMFFYLKDQKKHNYLNFRALELCIVRKNCPNPSTNNLQKYSCI